MAYQFRRLHTVIYTVDEKIIFRPDNQQETGPNSLLRVIAGTASAREEALLFGDGNEGAEIPRRERRRYLQAMHKLFAAAGYDLDIRCKLHVVWETTDGQWRLDPSNHPRPGWIAHRHDQAIDPMKLSSPTRVAAIEQAIADTI